MRVALVLWTGVLGGAETMTSELALALRDHDIEATLVFVTDGAPLRDRLRARGIPYRELGFARGSQILRHPRRYAAGVAAAGPQATLLMSPGYMAVALRAGGYRGRVVAVEHGALLRQRVAPQPRRHAMRAARALGARCTDVEVAVSEFMLGELRKGPHARELRCIPNGVDIEEYAPRTAVLDAPGPPVVGWAGRVIAGKGVDDLIRALALLARRGFEVRARVAGDGPHLPALRTLAAEEAVEGRVEFPGRVQDMPAFWNGCDTGVALTHALTESFGRSTLEAAACGRPVVVTRNGGLVDLVEDGVSGRIVAPEDPAAVAGALEEILGDAAVARAAGAAARALAARRFGMAATAAAYASALSGR